MAAEQFELFEAVGFALGDGGLVFLVDEAGGAGEEVGGKLRGFGAVLFEVFGVFEGEAGGGAGFENSWRGGGLSRGGQRDGAGEEGDGERNAHEMNLYCIELFDMGLLWGYLRARESIKQGVRRCM